MQKPPATPSSQEEAIKNAEKPPRTKTRNCVILLGDIVDQETLDAMYPREESTGEEASVAVSTRVANAPSSQEETAKNAEKPAHTKTRNYVEFEGSSKRGIVGPVVDHEESTGAEARLMVSTRLANAKRFMGDNWAGRWKEPNYLARIRRYNESLKERNRLARLSRKKKRKRSKADTPPHIPLQAVPPPVAVVSTAVHVPPPVRDFSPVAEMARFISNCPVGAVPVPPLCDNATCPYICGENTQIRQILLQRLHQVNRMIAQHKADI